MKSLYGQYLEERENQSIVESEDGFATYKIFDNGECYLRDIFVVLSKRNLRLATEMADKVVEIAKEHRCHTLTGSVCVDDKNATRNMKVFLAYGMQIQNVIGSMIFLNKDISGSR